MLCPKCGSEMSRNGMDRRYHTQKWKCKDSTCNYEWRDGQRKMNGEVVDVSNLTQSPTKSKVGISLHEFRDKYDIEHIVQKTMNALDPAIIYEKIDICKLAGLSPGTPGLGPVIESMSDYQGKAGGKLLYSHPETITMLKEEAKMI